MDNNVFIDLATESLRKYGELPPDFAEKMAKRIRRKFRVKLKTEKINELAMHYKEIYTFGKSILQEHLSPSQGKYTSAADVDTERFLANLKKKYPDEIREIIQIAAGYVIYYEYLR